MTRPRTVAVSAALVLCGLAFVIPGVRGAPAPKGTAGKAAAPGEVRPVPPPPDKELAPADRAELEKGVAALGHEIDGLRQSLKGKAELLALLPDVEIYHKAVRTVLQYHELCDPKQARKALADGTERAKQLAAGSAPWVTMSGVRAYVSKIDGSIQPYQLQVPASVQSAKPEAGPKYRLDVSFHGRDEKLTELSFISKAPGNAPAGGEKFVAALYGRYCNANKFAGEIDCLEVIADIERRHPIDENRILEIGFSMGGAAAWQFAVHHSDLWAAASPGAGFAESEEFLHLAQSGELESTPWYQKTLWHLYDCTDYAANLFDVPTIAYAGEIDPQKQSSDVMMKATADEGLTLRRLIGPNTKHAYEKATKQELDRQLDEIVAKGRNPVPSKIRFTTWTLRYNRMFWVTLDGLDKHWERARADGEVTSTGVTLKTQNVSALTVAFPPGHCPLTKGTKPAFDLDGTKLEGPAVADGAYAAHFVKSAGAWKLGESEPAGLHKRHGLQGPIDDAFMDSFTIVRPTGKPLNAKTGAWAAAECDHAIAHWQKQFRGEPRVKTDAEVTDADAADGNLVLFGDPSSNKVLAKIADRLPIKWAEKGIAVGDQTYAGDHHAAVFVYPNPMNPSRYVVVNSGFTFREADYLNNARQVPKLPDWVVIDVSTPSTPTAPGKVEAAGFFGERWELTGDAGQPRQ